MGQVIQQEDGKIRCGLCGRQVVAEYKAYNPAPCGCVWDWQFLDGHYHLAARPAERSWPENER